jgi:hypothetical protein
MESLRELTDIELDEVNGGAAGAVASSSANTAAALASDTIQVTIVPGLIATTSAGGFAVSFAF